jgi:hypothetical protein
LLAPLDLDIHSGYISHEFLTFEPRAEKMKPIKTSLLARVSLSWYSKLRFKSDPFSFGRKVEESQKVLICMPSDVDGFTMARDLLADFIRIFRPREVYVLVPFLEGGVYLSDSSDYRVVVVDRNDLDFFSLPRKGFVQKLTQLGSSAESLCASAPRKRAPSRFTMSSWRWPRINPARGRRMSAWHGR